jgi:hypothetical protein
LTRPFNDSIHSGLPIAKVKKEKATKNPHVLSVFEVKSCLVGGFNPSEKYEFVRLDHHPSYWGK